MSMKVGKFVRITKLLLAGLSLFCVSWIASVNEWHVVRWSGGRGGRSRGFSTMRTIIGYSAGKLAEMERPSPVTCDRLPTLPEIPYHNNTWNPGAFYSSPWQKVVGTNVSLYAAYYDGRTTQKYIRILAMLRGRNFSSDETLYCQTRSLSSNEDFIEVVAAKPFEIWWHTWDAASINKEKDIPVLFSCPLTEALTFPSAVSIVTQPCDNPTNAFHIQGSTPVKKYKRKFVICVKDMNFDKDISRNLIEWIEMNKLLGVDTIDAYVGEVSKETERVLQYYRDMKFVRLFNVPIRRTLNRPLWQRRRDHIITYNDCLYRNIKDTEYIIPLDVDEIILPKKSLTLSDLILRLNDLGWDSSQKSAIIIRNVFFFDFMQDFDKYAKPDRNAVHSVDLDETVRLKDYENLDIGEIDDIELADYSNNLNIEVIGFNISSMVKKYKTKCGVEISRPKMTRNVISSSIVSPIGSYSKSIMMTQKVLTAFNHYPLTSVGSPGNGPGWALWAAPLSEVQLNHYKETCNTTIFYECRKYLKKARIDASALRLHHQLTNKIANATCAIMKFNNYIK